MPKYISFSCIVFLVSLASEERWLFQFFIAKLFQNIYYSVGEDRRTDVVKITSLEMFLQLVFGYGTTFSTKCEVLIIYPDSLFFLA